MAQDWDDRHGRGRGRDDPRRDRSRGWMDRAGDEVRSWSGDEDAERRRRMDEARGYGMMGFEQRDARILDDRGPYGGRFSDGPGHDPGYGGNYGFPDPGMTALGMGMSSYPPSLGMERGQPDDRGQGFGRRGESWRGEDWHGREERGLLDRAGDEVASWFGDEDARRRREMDTGHRGRGPRNYSRSDDRIREDISERLSDDPRLDATDIEVSVSGGEITLDGTVDSRFARRHAEDLAEACSGVRHVQNNLRVTDRHPDAGRIGGSGPLRD